MSYHPLTSDPDTEFRQISNEFDRRDLIKEFSPQNSEPLRVRDGMLVYADGTNWDPGAGGGLYFRHGGAWVKL